MPRRDLRYNSLELFEIWLFLAFECNTNAERSRKFAWRDGWILVLSRCRILHCPQWNECNFIYFYNNNKNNIENSKIEWVDYGVWVCASLAGKLLTRYFEKYQQQRKHSLHYKIKEWNKVYIEYNLRICRVVLFYFEITQYFWYKTIHILNI